MRAIIGASFGYTYLAQAAGASQCDDAGGELPITPIYDRAARVADNFECVHDLRLVLAFVEQAAEDRAALDRDPGELGNRVLRVLLSGAGQPPRLSRWIERVTPEDHAGSN